MWRVAAVVGVAAAGCGRLGFDDLAATDGAADACASCEQGLVAHWRFDETTGTTAADEAGGHTGMLRTGGTWSPGVRDGAIELAGSFITSSFDLARDTGPTFAIAMWVRLAPETEPYDRYFAQYFYAGTDSGSLLMDTSDDGHGVRCIPNLGVRWPFLGIDGVIPYDAWHHVACTYDGTEVRLYVDGVVRDTSNVSGGGLVMNAAYPTVIGASIDPGMVSQNEFNGRLDDVRVYTRGLTPDEVTALATP